MISVATKLVLLMNNRCVPRFSAWKRKRTRREFREILGRNRSGKKEEETVRESVGLRAITRYEDGWKMSDEVKRLLDKGVSENAARAGEMIAERNVANWRRLKRKHYELEMIRAKQ